MRDDNPQFRVDNEQTEKEPRYVFSIDLDGTLQYITSHSDIANVPASPMLNAVSGVSATSQTLNPDRANSTIGSMSFDFIDEGDVFTDLIRANLLTNVGLRGRTVQAFLGYKSNAPGALITGPGSTDDNPDFDEFVLYQTQIIRNVRTREGSYNIQCADIQRETKKEIFNLALTYLTSDITDATTTIPVLDLSGFEGVVHGTSYSDAPGVEVIYIRMKQTGEIIRCPVSGISGNSFTGVTREVFGTKAQGIDVDTTLQSDRRPKVEEYVYLELPGVKLAKAILTGEIHGTADVLPSGWHAGVPTAFFRESDFTNIGTDLWDTTDDTKGIVLRFDGIEKQDAKKFLETEIYLLLGLFSPVYADGQLGLKRMVPSLADSPYLIELTDKNVVGHGQLQHDMESMHNNFRIDWNHNGDRFIRSTILIDSTSITRHGKGREKRMAFRGLAGTRFTQTVIAQLLTSFRDMYSGPPLRLEINGYHGLNQIEVGDPVRINLSGLKDFSNTGVSLNRTMVVHGMTVDWLKGVKFKLFGSAERVTETSPTTDASVLPAGFYAQAGTALSSIPGLMTGDITNAGTFTLSGDADMNAAGAIFYHDNPLTISSGTTLIIEDNVQLRVNGFLTINGTIDGKEKGQLSGADLFDLDQHYYWADDINVGTQGFIGHSASHNGLLYRTNEIPSWVWVTGPFLQKGLYDAFPNLVLQVDDTGNGEIAGIPADMRGTGGPAGQRAGQKIGINGRTHQKAAGGTGGRGGGALTIISKGGDFGIAGDINLDGQDSTEPGTFYTVDTYHIYGGAGGAGAPGALLWLLDGASVTFPDIAGHFSAVTGAVTAAFALPLIPGPGQNRNLNQVNAPQKNMAPFDAFFRISSFDQSGVNFRIQFLAGVETAEQDQDTIEATPGIPLSTFITYSDNSLANVPLTPVGDGDTLEWRRNPDDLTNAPRWISFKNAVSDTSGVWQTPSAIGGLVSIEGKIVASQPLTWLQKRFAGPWVPSVLTLDFDCTFEQDAVDLARIARRITIDRLAGLLSVTTVAHSGGDLNTSRVAVDVDGGSTNAVKLQFDYSFDGLVGTVVESANAVREIGDELIPDSDVTDASLWDVSSSNAAFDATAGADGDAAIRGDNDLSFGGSFYVETPTNIDELPTFREGAIIQYQLRILIDDQWNSASVHRPTYRIYDANGVLMDTTFGDRFMEEVPALEPDEWQLLDGYQLLREADISPAPSGPKPWYIALGFDWPKGASFAFNFQYVDKVSAKYQAQQFGGGGSPDGGGKVGLVPIVGKESAGRVLKDDGTWGESPGGLLNMQFNFDTSTTAADPGSNEFRMNSATPANVTAIYVDDINVTGEDIGVILGFLTQGNLIYIEQGTDPARAILLQVVGSITDNAGWWTINVRVVGSGNIFQTTQPCILHLNLGSTDRLYDGATLELIAQDHDATDNITGAGVLHHSGTRYDVGLGVMPKLNFTANTTIGDTHWHKRLVHNGTVGASRNLTFNTLSTMGQDVVLWVQAKNGPVVLVDGTMILHFYDGKGAVPPTGNITIARGGWATIVKDADSAAHVTGVGLS